MEITTAVFGLSSSMCSHSRLLRTYLRHRLFSPIGATLRENKRSPEVVLRNETITGLILLRHNRP